MKCTNNNIKELLPKYRKNSLSGEEKLHIEKHVKTCEDCRIELSVLRMMGVDAVPDPGETFWAEMPDRVYRSVQEQKARKPRFSFGALVERMVLPRWALAAAAAGVALTVSWLVMHPLPKDSAPSALLTEESVYEEGIAADAVLAHPVQNLAELTSDQLAAVDAWVSSELSGIASDAGTTMAFVFDTDLTEDLSDLNPREVDRLATMLQKLVQEEG
jgi:anti-sigma factor RsiW